MIELEYDVVIVGARVAGATVAATRTRGHGRGIPMVPRCLVGR